MSVLSEQRFCEQCCYCEASRSMSKATLQDEEIYTCTITRYDFVTGQKFGPVPCRVSRSAPEMCGFDGRWWEIRKG